MQFLSGIIFAFTAIALYDRFVHREAKHAISSVFVFLFVLSFPIFCGVLWELYEFSCDRFFGTAMQDGGNKDTMIDLIAITVGGLVIAIWAGVSTKIKNRRVS